MTDDDKTGSREPMQTEINQRKPRGRLGRDVQGKIGQQLRTIYDNVVNEGVPDRFSEMLRRLEEQQDQKEKGVE